MRFGSLGPVELILIVLAIVLIFGASKIGDIGGALGKSIKEFKKASKDEDEPVETVHREVVTTREESPVVTSITPERTETVSVGDFRPPDTKTS